MNAQAARSYSSETATVPLMANLKDPRIAASGIINALLDIDGHVTRERQGAVLDTLARAFNISETDSRELAIMGAWIAAQADTPEEAVFTLSTRLRAMRSPGAQAVAGTMRAMIDAVMGDADGRVSPAVQRALSTATAGHA